MSGEGKDGCEDAGGRLRGGGNMLFFGCRYLAPSGWSFGCLWAFFVSATGDKCCECGAS